jgi:hypothetical protein
MGEVVTFSGLVRELGPTTAILVVAIVAWWKSSTSDGRQKELLVGQQGKVFDALLERVLHGDDNGAPSLGKLQQSVDEIQATQDVVLRRLDSNDAQLAELTAAVSDGQTASSTDRANLHAAISLLPCRVGGQCNHLAGQEGSQ